MQMQMVHRLTAIFACVHNYPIASGEPLLTSDLRGGPEQMAKQRAVVLVCLMQRANMFPRHYEYVYRRFGADVREGVAQLVLVDGR
jgi:hypothetical protein